jgi:hypothetical protein
VNFLFRDFILFERFVVFIEMIQVMAFWVMTLYSNVVRYQCFGKPCCFHLHAEAGDSMVFQNTGILPHHDTASQPRGSCHEFILFALFIKLTEEILSYENIKLKNMKYVSNIRELMCFM